MRLLKLLLLGICWLPAATAAWAQGRVSGVVTDSLTHEPLAFASVFMANTTLGATTDDQGRFEFSRVPKGAYDIVGSYVGYKLHKEHIVVTSAPQTVTLTLASSGPKLDEVVVKANSRDADDYRRFSELLLGQSQFSKDCRITNPGEVDVAYNDTTKQLSARADNFVQVENQALGYRVKYYGLRFNADFDDGTTSFYGEPQFEEMAPKDDAQRRLWAANRLTAYNGSLTHFMRSVYTNTLKANGFLAQQVAIIPNKRAALADTLRQRLLRRGAPYTRAEQDSLTRWAEQPPVFARIQPGIRPIDSLRRVSADRQHVYLRFTQQLQVAYFGEAPDPGYKQPMSPLGYIRGAALPEQRQVSRLILFDPEVEILPNGSLADPQAVAVGEYWGFEKIGEFLPRNYEPPVAAKNRVAQ